MTKEIKDKSTILGNEKIPKLILSYFLTAFIGLVLNTIYNLTDTLFISRGVGDIAMGGVALIVPFVLFQGAISTMIGGGTSVIVAKKLGESKYSEAGQTTFNAMFVFYLVSILITVLGLIFIDEILILFGAKKELFNYAKEYFKIILIGNIFSTGFSSIIRAEGKILYGTLIWIVPITLNIILDAILIFGFKLGVRGSAIATIVSQFISFMFCIIFFARFSSQKFVKLKINFNKIKDILKLGLPALIQVAAFSVTIAIINLFISKIGGDMDLIAFGYMNKLVYYFMVPFVALAQSILPIVSYNYGANNSIRVKQTIKSALLIAFIYSLMATLLIALLAKYLMMIFTTSFEVIDIGKRGLQIIAAAFLFMPLPMLIGSSFQAIGKSLTSVFIYSIQFVVLIPLLFALYCFYLDGIWIAFVLSYTISAVVSIIHFAINKKYSLKTKTNCQE